MTAVLISVKPKWCEKILNGDKTIEIRKSKPKIETPFKCYIYCTKERTRGELVKVKSESLSILFGKDTCIGTNNAENEDIRLKGKIIGEFICDDIKWANALNLWIDEDAKNTLKGSCLTKEDMYKYLNVKSGTSRYDKKYEFYRWHISELKIYDTPKELNEFIVERYPCLAKLKRPPQSWCYVTEINS